MSYVFKHFQTYRGNKLAEFVVVNSGPVAPIRGKGGSPMKNQRGVCNPPSQLLGLGGVSTHLHQIQMRVGHTWDNKCLWLCVALRTTSETKSCHWPEGSSPQLRVDHAEIFGIGYVFMTT